MINMSHALSRADMVFANRPGLIARGARSLILALRIRRERQQLASLTDEQLADIGVGRTAARAEANRELFDLPAHRKSGLYL